jgi:hypothetical protein
MIRSVSGASLMVVLLSPLRWRRGSLSCPLLTVRRTPCRHVLCQVFPTPAPGRIVPAPPASQGRRQLGGRWPPRNNREGYPVIQTRLALRGLPSNSFPCHCLFAMLSTALSCVRSRSLSFLGGGIKRVDQCVGTLDRPGGESVGWFIAACAVGAEAVEGLCREVFSFGEAALRD